MAPDAPQISFNPKRALFAGMASVFVVVVLIAIKALAYATGGSAGILAALVDSVVDAAASIMSLLAIHISMKPADNHHRHGHGKIEGLSAFGQGLFIFFAAVFLGIESVDRLRHPVAQDAYGLGMLVMAISIALSVALVAIQTASLRHAESLAVQSDRAHYGSDIVVNVVVLLVLAAQSYGAPNWLDPLVALAVAFWLVRIAWQVASGGVDMLLDREVSDEQRLKIVECIRSCDQIRGFHDLRTRMVGMNLNISLDIEVDADLTLRDAHAIAHTLENTLLQHFPHAEIMIHVDPEGDVADARHSSIGFRPV